MVLHNVSEFCVPLVFYYLHQYITTFVEAFDFSLTFISLFTDEHVYNNVTALVFDEPQNQVIINTSNGKIVKKMKKGSDYCIEIAPGENKIPTDWLREDDFDTTGKKCLNITLFALK